MFNTLKFNGANVIRLLHDRRGGGTPRGWVESMSRTQSHPAGDGAQQEDEVRGEPASEPESGTLSRDEVFETLSNRRRRFVLHHLQEVDESATLSEIAEQVAAWENDSTMDAISSSERKTVYTSLQQFHLPKMEEMGVVSYDSREGTVALTEAAADLDIYLEVVDRYDIPWSFYYVGLSAIGSVMVALSAVGIEPFAAVPFSGWTVFVLTTLTVSAVAHYMRTRQMHLGSDSQPPEVRQ